MQPRRVLVTGVSRYLGGEVARTLAADPAIDAVVGVDTVAPTADLGRTQFVRADIRNPMIAKVINTAGIDTVVHMNLIATPDGAGGRTAMKEINVIGTMQLLAACQKAPSVRKLVLKSTTAVYGSSARGPALFTEDCEPRELDRNGYSKDAIEVESYVRGFVRRRPGRVADRPALHQLHRAERRQPVDALPGAAGRADDAGSRPASPALPRRRRGRDPPAGHARGPPRHLQRRRRRRAAALAGRPPHRAARVAGATRCGQPRRATCCAAPG